MFLLGGLAFSGYMSERVAAGLLVAYLLLSIEVHLATYTLGHFHLSFWKFGPTELRIVLAVGGAALVNHQWIHIGGVRALLFDAGAIVAIAGLLIVFVASAVRNAADLYRAEPLPERGRRERAA